MKNTTISWEHSGLMLSMGNNMENAMKEVLSVFYKESLSNDHVNQAFERLLYLCHYCVLTQALSMIRLICDVVIEKNIVVDKDVIDTIKEEYSYCDLGFLKSVRC